MKDYILTMFNLPLPSTVEHLERIINSKEELISIQKGTISFLLKDIKNLRKRVATKNHLPDRPLNEERE